MRQRGRPDRSGIVIGILLATLVALLIAVGVASGFLRFCFYSLILWLA